MNKKYSEKLLDPRWQRKRLEILKRDDFTCRTCGDPKHTLNVHHLSYRGNPWDVPDEELVTLCRHCHLIVSHYGINIVPAISTPFACCLKLDRGAEWICLFQHESGLIICSIAEEDLREIVNVADRELRNVMQSIMNNWLVADKQNLLIDQSPVYL